MALVAFLVVIFLLAFVVPRIVGIFSHLKQALPLPTRILIALSDGLAAGWWILAGGAFLLAVAWRRYTATAEGALKRDAAALRLPLAGRILHLSALSRFARTLSALLSGGLPVDRALRIVAPAIGNRLLAARVAAAHGRVVEGASLSEALRGFDEIPPTMVQMVAAGEESGRLDFILGKLADSLDGEVEARTSRLLSLLEPVIILFMGAVVASIVVAVLLPLLEVSQIVK
jgi:type II secretory pathway component PulF